MNKEKIHTLRKKLSILSIEDFINDLEMDNKAKLTKQEIRDKCFELLGLLEEYQGLSGRDVDANFIVDNIDFADDDIETNLDSFYNKLSENESKDEGSQSEEKKLKVLEKARESIDNKIRSILSLPQVKKIFEKELKEELLKFKKARNSMKEVSKMQVVERAATSQMVQTYLQSKRNSGKLTQSAENKISTLQKLKQEAEARESGTRNSAAKETKGWLVAQDLLKYKDQIQNRGFALTPTRKVLLDKITEQAMSGKKVFLVGSTGTGKTELAFYALDEISGGYEIIPWHEGTTTRDIFGYREIGPDEHGNITSGTKPGPFTKAVDEGKGVIHDEYTVGSTRTMMAQKYLLNAKAGDEVKIPGFNGQAFEVSDKFAEIFTGNLKDEKTQDREDMDPAILRMFKGIKVQYMPASEMTQIILANLMEENGVMKLSPSEVSTIQRLSRSAEWMQMFHDRQFKAIKEVLTPEQLTLLTSDLGGDLADAKLDKNFLDPGTLFSLFANLDFAKAKGKTFNEFLSEALTDFLQDPKNDNNPEEKKLSLLLFKLTGIATNDSVIQKVEIKEFKKKDKKDYILPSELHFLAEKSVVDEDPFDEEDEKEGAKEEKEKSKEEKVILGIKMTRNDIHEKIKDEDKDKIIHLFNSLSKPAQDAIKNSVLWKDVVINGNDWNGVNFKVPGILDLIKNFGPLFNKYNKIDLSAQKAVQKNPAWKQIVLEGKDWNGSSFNSTKVNDLIKKFETLFHKYNGLNPFVKKAVQKNPAWKQIVLEGKDWNGLSFNSSNVNEFIKKFEPLFNIYDKLSQSAKTEVQKNPAWKQIVLEGEDWNGKSFNTQEIRNFINTLT